MSKVEDRTRHAILLILGETRNLVNSVPLPPKHELAAKFRFTAIGEAGNAKRALEDGKLDYAWRNALQSLEAATLARLIHLFGPDSTFWDDWE